MLSQRRMGEQRGGVSGWAVIFLTALAGMIYSIVSLGPAFYQNLEAKQAMREVANMAHMEKSDDRLTYELIRRIARVGSHFVVEDGERVEVSPIMIEEDQVDIERREEEQMIIIRMRYTRQVTLPGLKKTVKLNFSPEIEADTSPVRWSN